MIDRVLQMLSLTSITGAVTSKLMLTMQALGVPVQAYPASMVQKELHPSPFLELPSSHCYPLVMMLSLQIDLAQLPLLG